MIKRHSVILCFFTLCTAAWAQTVASQDTIQVPDTIVVAAKPIAGTIELHDTTVIAIPDSVPRAEIIQPQIPKDYWKTMLRKGKLNVYDEKIEYPTFLQFCLGIYRWADKTFNTYDTDYVVGTGKRFKVMIRNDNWLDSYIYNGKQDANISRLTLASNVSANLGAYISYMAVSIGYSFDLGKIFGGKPVSQNKFEYNFSCALFNVDVYYFKNQSSCIRRFDEYNGGKAISEHFPGLTLKAYGVDAFYFFNNKKYSQGAAYNFSKYQLRSAGSFIAGLSISHRDTKLDFSKLSEPLIDYIMIYKPMLLNAQFEFKYNTFCLLLGYGYNWVFHKNWLFNITAYPAIGFMHTFETSVDGKGERFSLNLIGKLALVRNCGNFFYGLQAKAQGFWYHSQSYNFVSSVENVMVNIGFRF